MPEALVREVARISRNRIVDAGFRARAGDIFTRPLGGDVLAWLALNRAVRRHDGLVEVNPVVGVRHQVLEAKVAQLCGDTVHSYIPPTMSISVGYASPEGKYQSWLFGDGRDFEVVAADLLTSVLEFGVPYMEKRSSLEAIVNAMARGEGVGERTVYRLPVGHLLLGDPARAEKEVKIGLTAIAGRDDLAARRYSSFAAALRKMISEGC